MSHSHTLAALHFSKMETYEQDLEPNAVFSNKSALLLKLLPTLLTFIEIIGL